MDVKYDQHFLFNKEILKKIVNISNITNKDTILEIGPGKGSLTKEILNLKPSKLVSIDIDDSFLHDMRILEEKYSFFNFEVGNGLDLISQVYTKIIANIPYSITEPLYRKLIEKGVNSCTLLHGKTFYETIIRRDSKWHYFIPAFYDIKLIREVKGEEFEPPTKVNSVVVNLKLKDNLTKFDKFLQILYSKEDRSIKNALIFSLVDSLNLSKKEAKIKIDKLNISENNKLKDISNAQFVRIIKEIKYLF